MSNDILTNLDPAQQAAVAYLDGPQLVIAGAGAGKTRVLTYKVAYLLQQGYKPWNILALTFTNKAAAEMKERVASIVGADEARRIHMGTFHSVFARVLRTEATLLGYQSNFTIYDQSDSRSLVKKIIKELGYDEKQHSPSKIADKISMAKNRLVAPERALGTDSELAVVVTVYKEYAKRCLQANAMDFDDLLLNTYRLFERHDDVRQKYAARFQYVLVDEYQDTNYAQQQIVHQLAKDHQMLCVVGDDAQSIYAFRGAEIDNILNFTTTYPTARLFKLERNYRSTKTIVEAANSLIYHNQKQIRKESYSERERGDKIALHMLYSDREEAALVGGSIERLHRTEHCAYRDFAILYRTNSQSRTFEEELRRRSIPYRIYGGLSFYQRKEIKDVMAYFRLVVNHDDEEAFRRVVNYPKRGIGDSTVTRLVEAAANSGSSLWQVAAHPAANGLNVSQGTANKLMAFCQMVESWSNDAHDYAANALGSRIINESGIYKDIYSGKEPEDISRQENLTELLASLDEFVKTRIEEDMAQHTTLADFMQEASLLSDLDSDNDNADDDRVLLMTVHSAKGLEFPNVFVVGMEENIFPSLLSNGSPKDLEEERRLFYVAITRACRRCVLTCAETRFRYGRMESSSPSRFLQEIDPRYISTRNSVYGGKGRRNDYNDAPWGNTHSRQTDRPEWMQQPRPVASQFRADPMPRAVPPRREPAPASPFSDAFAAKLQMAQRGMKPVSRATTASTVAASHNKGGNNVAFTTGQRVEHQRFGIGTIIGTEGQGENFKVKVDFQHAGTKQLLVKFANLKVID